MASSAVKSICVFPLAIPLRRKVTHAASERRVTNPIVVAVELNSHVVGYGETLPRSYVTGETVASVIDAIETVFTDHLLTMRPDRFPFALEAIEALPWHDRAGKSIPAARAAIELALLDAYSRHFGRPISDAVGWMGFNEFGSPGSIPTIRHSGVLATTRIKSVKRDLRLMWWYGLRDFKLKVGDKNDETRLRWAWKYLARAIAGGRATLRIDANGAWTVQQAIERLTAWRDVPLTSVEQPLPKGFENDLPELKAGVPAPLVHDESLTTLEDAERLVTLKVADAFNIRISKCGGLLPSLRIAHFARRHDVTVQLGCMVGETSILSAAARKFLELVRGVRFAEGNFGSFLLTDDVVRRPLRFSYGGRVEPLSGYGWAIDIDESKLAALTLDKPRRIEL